MYISTVSTVSLRRTLQKKLPLMNTHCPKCQTPIKVTDLMQAGLPNMIKCSKCKTRIQFNISNALLYSVAILAIVVAILASLGITFFIQQHVFVDVQRLLVWMPTAFIFTIIAEYLMAKWLLITKGVSQHSS